MPLIRRSHQQGTLFLTDLYDLLPEYDSRMLTERLESCWFDERKRHAKKPSLLRATIHAMGWRPVLIGLCLLPAVIGLVLLDRVITRFSLSL